MDKKDLKEIMTKEHCPKEIARNKAEVYVNFCVHKLREIADLIEDYDFDEINEYLFFSPAGDGNGEDNECIDFGYTKSRDIADAIKEIKDLFKFANE
jgi:hypothetical protein